MKIWNRSIAGIEAIVINNNSGKKEEDMRVREKKCKSLMAQAINDEQFQYVIDKKSTNDMYIVYCIGWYVFNGKVSRASCFIAIFDMGAK